MTVRFREVTLPEVSGKLFLHSMPGHYEPFEEAVAALADTQVQRVVCLAPTEEVERKSPRYARALAAGALPAPVTRLPIPDFGVPDDRDGFLGLARELAAALRGGQRVLIHCGAGIGRTGTLASAILLCLGLSAGDARVRVSEAGAGAERPAQEDLLAWVGRQARPA